MRYFCEWKQRGLARCRSAGLFYATLRSKWRRQRLLILCYHGVSLHDEYVWKPTLYVTQAHLERRLGMLRREGYHIIGLGQAIRLLYAGELPERSIVMTFDDGSHDFYESAYPVLSTYQVPTTVYLTSYYCSRSFPVFGQICSYMLWKARGRSFSFPELFLQDRDLTHPAERDAIRTRLLNYAAARRLSAEDQNELARTLALRLDLDYPALLRSRILQLMSPAEIASLASQGVDFQLHTHRHRVPRDRSAFEREIEENRQWILQTTGVSPTHFCYPSGSVDPMFLPWLRQLRIASGTTCEPGCASNDQDPLLLPRFQDSSLVSDTEFEGWITGFIPFARKALWM